LMTTTKKMKMELSNHCRLNLQRLVEGAFEKFSRDFFTLHDSYPDLGVHGTVFFNQVEKRIFSCFIYKKKHQIY
jgi:hypothetical protein